MWRFVQGLERRLPAPGVAAVCVLAGAGAVSAQTPVPARLTLGEAVRLALARHPRLDAARNVVEASAGDIVTAGLWPNPAVTFDSVGRPPTAAPAAPDDHEYVIRIDQEIEPSRRRQLRTQAATVATAAATFGAADVERRLVLEVRKAYYQVVLAKADLEVARTTLSEVDQIVSLNQARLTQGEISGVELRRTQVERLRFLDDVFASDLALRNARAALLAWLNVQDLAQVFDVTDPLTAPPPLDGFTPPADGVPDVAALLRDAATRRPDLQATAAQVQRAQADAQLQRALRMPAVRVGAGYSHIAGLNTVAFAATVPLPIFNRNAGAIVRADAESRLAENERQAAVLNVALDVQQAANAVDVSRARVAAIETQFLVPAREARDIVLSSYRLGEANLIDLLDAQRAFRDTQRTYNRALFDQHVSLIALAAAVGGSPRP